MTSVVFKLFMAPTHLKNIRTYKISIRPAGRVVRWNIDRTCVSNYVHGFMWHEITHSCPFNGGLTKPLLKLEQWMSNYTPLFYMYVITYPCPNMMLVLLIPVSKRDPRCKMVMMNAQHEFSMMNFLSGRFLIWTVMARKLKAHGTISKILMRSLIS